MVSGSVGLVFYRAALRGHHENVLDAWGLHRRQDFDELKQSNVLFKHLDHGANHQAFGKYAVHSRRNQPIAFLNVFAPFHVLQNYPVL